MKIRDKWKKTKITLRKTKKNTKIEQAIPLQKNIYYNIITITLQNTKSTKEIEKKHVKKSNHKHQKKHKIHCSSYPISFPNRRSHSLSIQAYL